MDDADTTPPPLELPLFPTSAPPIFADPAATRSLFEPVLAALADVVAVGDAPLDGPTPCAGFDLGSLQRHVLAWLQFFAAAVNDPDGATNRPDPETWELAPGQDPAAMVHRAAADLGAAIDAGVAHRTVVMSQARMAGDGVLAMALGEYAVHGWDLAVATGRPWSVADDAADAALGFLATTVTPEFRGPDSGFFDAEVPAPAKAGAFERLLCFAGRRPDWQPPATDPNP